MLSVFLSCSRHEELPPLLPLVEAPTPDLTVFTADSLVFNLSWTVSDDTNVIFYRIYTEIPLLGTTMDTTMVLNAQVNTGIQIPGILFGVSSVTFQNVESLIDVQPGY